MSNIEDAAASCIDGLSPVQIAERLGIPASQVRTHLLAQVGEGRLRRSDILFSIPAQQRELFEQFVKSLQTETYWDRFNAGRKAGFEPETFRLFLALSNDRVWRGDLYEYLADIEISLHDIVKSALIAECGSDEKGWWRRGSLRRFGRRASRRGKKMKLLPPNRSHIRTSSI